MVYELLRQEPWWQIPDEFVDRIDRVIDEEYGHDVGKKSMRKLLKALFIEWGDLYEASMGFLKTTKEERRSFTERYWGRRFSPYELVMVPKLGLISAIWVFSESPRILMHIPDEALLLGLLHHFLDLCAEYVNKNNVVSWSIAKSYAPVSYTHLTLPTN